MFAKMISMARTPEEAKEEAAKYDGPPTASVASSVPTYPYGLCLSLEDESLKKLGIGELPEVGEVIQFTAIAKVTSASSSEREKTDGSKEQCNRVELQITDMGVPAADVASRSIEMSTARRRRFYPAMETETG